MEPVLLTKAQARKIILHAAGLDGKGRFGTGPEAVCRVIDHLGFVQLDTNYVVERAHHHVMAARIPGYQKEWLTELCEDDRPEASTGWWDWRPAKVALERLHMEGKLMVTRNKTFHKVYDLPLNLLPLETGQTMPSPEEYAQYVIRRTLGALGIAYVKEIAWRARRVKGNLVKKELEQMLVSGEIQKVLIDGWKSAPLYMLRDQLTEVALSGEAFILSPFDILNVFRHRLKDFFDFDYQIECFVPAAKRKYGYFSLPVLVGDTFVARMDAKAERKQKVLLIHNLHFEDIELSENMIGEIVESLKEFVQFNQCRDIVFKKSNNDTYLKAISKSFSG
jgi:uncharacterized protein YcaQ